MSGTKRNAPEGAVDADKKPGADLASGTYEVLRARLNAEGDRLQERLTKLDGMRRQVFGKVDFSLLGTEHIVTENNCVPRDMTPVGDRFLFGYNVYVGLRSETNPEDVFGLYAMEEGSFRQEPLDPLADERFLNDFRQLYKYYRQTRFIQFFTRGQHLYMVFQVGREIGEIKAFKWLVQDGGQLQYIDNRSDHEVRLPPQHEFEWISAGRDAQRAGTHPHVAIKDILFVETIGGSLTVKIEDNTDVGEGIYSEPVDNPDQTLDDAKFWYAEVGHLILLKILPFQEEQHRYLVYSRKLQQIARIDAIEEACVLLPEDHGILHPRGFHLQTGERREFETDLRGLRFERRISSSNGEDFLFSFYQPDQGTYLLLTYNLITQDLATPIVCQGYCLFEDGRLIVFRAGEQPVKTHAIQVWQTPFLKIDRPPDADRDSYLFRIGNRDLVRAMASCHAILGLLARQEPYTGLYLDVVRRCNDTVDAFFWLDREEAFNLKASLLALREAAAAAVGEYEKVSRMKRQTRERIDKVAVSVRKILGEIGRERFGSIDDYVDRLSRLRRLRGESISLRDLPYADPEETAKLEKQIEEQQTVLANRAVGFLLEPDALTPYTHRIGELTGRVQETSTATAARELEKQITQIGAELDMLVEVVSNLKIDDATRRTRIVDLISSLFGSLNRARADIRNRMTALGKEESAAEFAAQVKLLDQTVASYLDVADSPAKCDEYLGKLMLQVEEMEGRFSEFEEFAEGLIEKREEVYGAFESRRLGLVEERNRRADGLFRSAERMLKGIRTRAATLKAVEEIHGYFAADPMVAKVRDMIDQLTALDDSVKAGDVQAQLKTAQQEAQRQLLDRQDLFHGGDNIISFGPHRFAVNTQPPDLTIIRRDQSLFLHLTGTAFLEKLEDPELRETEAAWAQEVVSETPAVYRGAYLAYLLFEELQRPGTTPDAAAVCAMGMEECVAWVQQFMSPRYAEGYVKGVSDRDAAAILRTLLDIHAHLGLQRYAGPARALARWIWRIAAEDPAREPLAVRAAAFGRLRAVFTGSALQQSFLGEIGRWLRDSLVPHPLLFPLELIDPAAEYLFQVLAGDGCHPVSPEAAELCEAFRRRLGRGAAARAYEAATQALKDDEAALLTLIREWLQSWLASEPDSGLAGALDEAAVLLAEGGHAPDAVQPASGRRRIEGLSGHHPSLSDSAMAFDYHTFMGAMTQMTREDVPRFNRFTALKHHRLEVARTAMRIDDFKPQVLTSFVRNRLIDKVYLPIVGANLAKQLGEVGRQTRTDRSGMLMLISPPGYGKTTLMEYIASRLGVVFMKINGPSIGHRVTSLDPAEAPNAAAREELHKLGLALEMGDNVMIYVDDIQHCNPEFLQKFISLCDAQRKIEGVYKGRSRTYDLRGKAVVVVMAGNPYTESGQVFRVPDMLANRADTYNLGDIIGEHGAEFEMSFIENALTSNPVLNRVTSRSSRDVYGIIRWAETGSREGVEFEVEHDPDELADAVAVLKKLLRVRQVVLRVNQEYIRSAAQSDEYRTEPAFKLQGSYRNMNRMAERVHPVMNDAEVEALIHGYYESEAQTLAGGAEANVLKYREIIGLMTPEEKERWDGIKRTFGRNLLLRGADPSDKAGQAIAQISGVSDGIHEIRATLEKIGAGRPEVRGRIETTLGEATLEEIRKLLQPLNKAMAISQAAAEAAASAAASAAEAVYAPRTGAPRSSPALKVTDSEIILTPSFVEELDEELALLTRLMRKAERKNIKPEEKATLLEQIRQTAETCRNRVADLVEIAEAPLEKKPAVKTQGPDAPEVQA